MLYSNLYWLKPWASSSAGRAPRSQRGGRGFESPLVHHNLKEIDILADPPKFDQVAKVANWGFRKVETSPNFFSPFEPKITFLEQSCVTLRDVSLRFERSMSRPMISPSSHSSS